MHRILSLACAALLPLARGVSGTTTTGGASGAAVGLHFKLAWRDDFDHFVETRSTRQTQIDVERLGCLAKSNQYKLISGNLANRVYQPKVVTFTWSPTADFHECVIEWRPKGVTFSAHKRTATCKSPSKTPHACA